MSTQHAMVETLLTLAEYAEHQVQRDIEQARSQLKQARQALTIVNKRLSELEGHLLLLDLEAARQALIDAAESDTKNSQDHLRQAAKLAKARAILSAPLGAAT